MASFWKWTGGTLALASLIYLGTIALSAIAIPWTPATFDTVAATTSNPGWFNEAKYVVLNKRRFAEPTQRVVVTGASNARDPFRPELMQARLPGWEVFNSSLSGAGISEYSDLLDVYYGEQDRAHQGRTVWVFAVTYMQFRPLPPEATTPLATEAFRAGLYGREKGRLVRQYPRPVEGAILAALRPQAVMAGLPNRIGRTLVYESGIPGLSGLAARLRGDDPVQGWIERIRHADLDKVTIPADVRAELLERRVADAGGDVPPPATEYVRFADLLRRIRAHGDSAVVLDLPLPTWHLAGARQMDAAHRARLAGVVQEFPDDSDVAFLSLREFNESENFFDSGHPKPRMWPVMSARLADWLRTEGPLSAKSSGPSPARK